MQQHAAALPEPTHIRVHQLEAGQNLESTLFRLQQGWLLHFKIGPTLLGQRVRLYINYPKNAETPFERKTYRELSWESEGCNQSDLTGLFAKLHVGRAGSFHYYFTQERQLGGRREGEGYLLVDPILRLGNGEQLLLECVQCQTYLSKLLGPLNQWESRLEAARQAGYNMIHLTPLQPLGSSNSSYCIQHQLELNPVFQATLPQLQAFISKLHREWGILTITDVVLNHSANESPWLQEHPECAYNLSNSPHLRPAYLLDRAIFLLTLDLIEGRWLSHGVSNDIRTEENFGKIHQILHSEYLTRIKIPEFYKVDVEAVVSQFSKKIKDLPLGGAILQPEEEGRELRIIQDPEFRRLKSTVDLDLALALYHGGQPSNGNTAAQDLEESCHKLRKRLKHLNREVEHEINIHLAAAVNNVLAAARHERLQGDGPKLGPLSHSHPLCCRYFHRPGPNLTLEEEEVRMAGPQSCLIMAHNGWVMGDDPLRDFAKPGSNVYIRRELIAWGDSVKLRYGDDPQDCPYLWEHMTAYVEQMASLCHGLRLDNCHSTPIHVAEYLLDRARKVRPELYVIAELFTANDTVDNLFVNRLGINSLIREGMSAHNSHELGRLIYRFGGEPVGDFFQPIMRPLTTSIAHAIFIDQTHDNLSPIQKRSVFDLLPSAALISMACCATGSTWGYDELVPHAIHVVDEKRLYAAWPDQLSDPGLIPAKKALNKLHFELGVSGFTQVYVDQVDENIVAVTRHCPNTHQSVILVARTAFRKPHSLRETGFIHPMCISGVVEEVVLEARLRPRPVSGSKQHAPWSQNPEYINGLQSEYSLELREHLRLLDSQMVEMNTLNEVEFHSFPPGSVVALRVSLSGESRAAVHRLRSCVAQFDYRLQRSSSLGGTQASQPDFKSIIRPLSLAQLNHVLFRCAEEEREEPGAGPYHIPGYGDLIYCGFQGVMSLLSTINLQNDLGHPLCENLRQGDWLPSYLVSRLERHAATKDLAIWFQAAFAHLRQLPRYLVPSYFDTLVTGAYSALLTATWAQMSPFVRQGSTFLRMLALGSVALVGHVPSSPLPDVGGSTHETPTLSAGLPHFAVGYARNWGRDTFISLRGLYLIIGRFEEARNTILAFGGCLRHGLIPNLLDRGTNARYNCRDAVWWWLQAIQDYCSMAPDGLNILTRSVARLYLTDDAEPGAHVQPLHDLMQEALQRHYSGIRFRERNAGPRIDSQMTDPGFNVEAHIDRTTGFVVGGNVHNCGTWMDKMGSAPDNRGKPATPRDGAAIELVGLCKSAVRWLAALSQDGIYPYTGVTSESGEELTFMKWGELIQDNFEKHFWVPEEDPPISPHVNQRGIYRDCVGATRPWEDFQLRPNMSVAMVVAPELFNHDHARRALHIQRDVLLGPLGMKTLDPSDWAYRPDYDNSDASCGFNYHQGPEWVWPVGYFLRAWLHFFPLSDFLSEVLSRHFYHLQSSAWKGLPELTNGKGRDCPHGCPIQAWSHACILEVLHQLHQSPLPAC